MLITALLGKRLIHRPINQLLAVADRWRQGDLAARSGIAPDPGEFGRLALAFDSMAAAQEARDRAVRASEAKLRGLSNQLEARVRAEVVAREDAQARAARAEALSALGQLAGGMAHNFNNVLQAILGAATLIERHPEDQASVRRRARLALRAAERGAEITRRLLAFGHRSNLLSEEIDACALLGRMRSLLAPVLGGQIRVEIAPGPGRPVLVADKGQLETALLNLAINARDAMVDGGRLTLAVSRETVPVGHDHPAGLEPGRYVWIALADTGQGMDEGTLKRATEPFFTTKGPGGGAGLGLSVVRGFVEQSGGGMSIDSAPGKGTTVTLWLLEAVASPPAAGVEDEVEEGANPALPLGTLSR